jgi:hypothetical protein
MTTEEKILEALRGRSLGIYRLIQLVDEPIEDINAALHVLRSEKVWVDKHAVSDGCKACSCSVSYVWRLTDLGRQNLPAKSEFNVQG